MKPLEIENLSFSYGEKIALNAVSLSLEKGRFCGLLGPNGAGKSTLFAILTGLLPTSAHHVLVAGHDVANDPRAALAKLGIVFQQPTLELDMSVEQNMRYFAALHGMSGKETDARIVSCLELVNMAERKNEKVRVLNGGHRRRMEIARALIHQPEILLLDEPTVGLDVHARESIVEDVHRLTDEGISVLWATHLVDEIWLDDDVVILYNGEVKKTGKTHEIATNSDLLQAFLEITSHELEMGV